MNLKILRKKLKRRLNNGKKTEKEFQKNKSCGITKTFKFLWENPWFDNKTFDLSKETDEENIGICVEYLKNALPKVLRLPIDLSCVSDSLLSQLAALLEAGAEYRSGSRRVKTAPRAA